ncbi:NAD(P)/FAD-dependent oxidoreductase [Flavobacterium orientale]|uniref:FAD-dependent oxidoreductase n=1 Tax=Flavobacterium orientale TaxID=1756020 RepID=A0A916XZG3_9FLAO|nr:NAD(P)/FAD-dependent oxidoreductase [Flavobacterium orientale]GGD24022.1 FAD-dependent oxidoreductase [Flavobacterium orientale]
MSTQSQIAIIGGGLAGLTAAIHLAKKGCDVTLFEKNNYPKHKVCGEFISNEVLPYLQQLGIDLTVLQPTQIHTTILSLPSGTSLTAKLPLGGFGISRFTLDHHLYQLALQHGVSVVHQTVTNTTFSNNQITLTTENGGTHTANVVLGAYGKRSNLDHTLERTFIKKKSPWLAVKAHYCGHFPNNVVALHNFEGGYCGVSKVENNTINICYLVQYDTFKQFKNIPEFETHILQHNPHLKVLLENATMLFVKPLTISQISFENKTQVENHILMLGDTAGLIHPLCGNGMAMAIHSAKIASECTLAYLNDNISRETFEARYRKQWNYHFKSRIQTGKLLSKLLLSTFFSQVVMRIVITFPKLVPYIISKTHGKPISE